MKPIRVLFLGDLVGRPGMRALFAGLAALAADTSADLVAVNGENAHDGFGIDAPDVERILAAGVAVITTGNHVWQRPDAYPLLDSEARLLRPENYPPGAPGHGSFTAEARGVPVAFLNLQGRERMGSPIDCPFRTARKAAARLREKAACLVVDFHAEDVREKEAMAWWLDGKASAVLGTHTHVQTADERILPGGTAYITDLGMCGPARSVIGTVPELSIRRSLTQLPLKMEVLDAEASLSGVLLTLDPETGRALAVERIRRDPPPPRP